MSAFSQSKATIPAVRLIDLERQPTPEPAKVIAIASVQAEAV